MDPSTTPIVLVTGATGRVGTLLRSAWTDDPPRGFVPLWQTRGPARDGWLRWDMPATPCQPITPEPAIVLNLAGVTGPDPDRLWQNSALARAAHAVARRSGCHHLFLASSSAVYGEGRADLMFDEDAPLRPVTPYGAAKADMERAALHWPRTTCLRIANVIGADSLIGAAPGSGIVLDPIPSGSFGPVRSWIGPRSFARALATLIDVALAGQSLPRTLNIAQSPALPMALLLDAASLRWQFGRPRAGIIAHVTLATDRLARFVTLPPASAAGLVAEYRSLAPA